MSALVARPARSRPAFSRHGVDATGPETPARMARHRTYHTLDALRGVAAIAVVLYHAAFFYGVAKPAGGPLAVDLFFVMSGFIIASRYESDLRAGLGFAGFLRIRLIRLYPLCLLGAVLGVIPALVALLSGHATPLYVETAASLPLAILMLPSPFALPHSLDLYPLNYVAWSLGLEILINIAYAATFRVWTLRRLVTLVVLAFVGLCVCAIDYGTLGGGSEWPNALCGLARVLYGFPMGMLIFRLHSARRFAFRAPWWVVLGLALGVFVFDPAWIHIGSIDAGWISPVWDLVAVTVVVPFIVAAGLTSEPPARLRGACALAGVSSYVIYSMHAPFIGLFMRIEERLHGDVATTSPLKAIVFTVLLLGLCTIVHVAYDRPVRRFLSGLGSPRRTAHVKN